MKRYTLLANEKVSNSPYWGVNIMSFESNMHAKEVQQTSSQPYALNLLDLVGLSAPFNPLDFTPLHETASPHIPPVSSFSDLLAQLAKDLQHAGENESDLALQMAYLDPMRLIDDGISAASQGLQKLAQDISANPQTVQIDMQQAETGLAEAIIGEEIYRHQGNTAQASPLPLAHEPKMFQNSVPPTSDSRVLTPQQAPPELPVSTPQQTPAPIPASVASAAPASASGTSGNNPSDAIVRITADDGPTSVGVQISHGTGFFITSNGEIVTDYHVVSGARGPITITLASGQTVQAQVVKTDQANDLALLQVIGGRNGEFSTLSIAGDSAASPSETAIGYPQGQSQQSQISGTFQGIGSFSNYSISDLNSLDPAFNSNRPADQFIMNVQPGDSGAPILNSQGQVVSIVDLGGENGSVNFAVGTPAQAIQNL